MNLATLLAAIIAGALLSCNNSSSSAPQEPDSPPETVINTPAPAEKTKAAAETSIAAVNCEDLLTTSIIESVCATTDIHERVTFGEKKGASCNRVYGKPKAYGDELIFIVSPSNSTEGASRTFDYMKKEYAGNGLKLIEGIGNGAFSLSFKNELTGRPQEQLVFYKKNLLIELKAQESLSDKTPCPCYDPGQLRNLASKIAERID